MFQPLETLSFGNAPQHFIAHLFIMPGWHKVVLTLAAVLGIVGGTGVAANKMVAPPKSDNGAMVQQDQASTGGSAPFGGVLGKASPHAMRIGVSIIIGFILGWIFRAFIKLMTLMLLIALGLFAALSYFHVVNVDPSLVKTQYASAMHWATEHFKLLKDAILPHLPSTGGGTLGTWLGMSRKN